MTTNGKAQVKKKPVKAEAHPARKAWQLSRMLDERTGTAFVGASYPNTIYGRQFAVFPPEARDSAGALRKALNGVGADLVGPKSAQIKFIEGLLSQPMQTYRLPKSPGFRDQATGFVLGAKMFGSAKGVFRQPKDLAGDTLGNQLGTLKSWNSEVGRPLEKTSYGSVAVMVALAAPLIGYIRGAAERTGKGAPLVPESFTLNFSGQSASGKTMVCKVAASVLGHPDRMAKWDFSRPGLERLCEEANDLPLFLDDTEKHVEEGGLKLKSALSLVTQYVAGNQSKALSQVAHQTSSPPRTWSTIALSSSPVPIDTMAAAGKWTRSLGERVRLINITVPVPEKGGVFDLIGSDQDLEANTKRLADKLVGGMNHNYGVLFQAWIKLLLEKDLSSEISQKVEFFVGQLADADGSYRQRLARKFGILYAAGQTAVEHGILAWSQEWPLKAVSKAYDMACQEIFAEEYAAKKKLRILRKRTKDSKYFPKAVSASKPVKFSKGALGLRCVQKGKQVCGIRDEDLRHFAGDSKIADGMLAILRKGGAMGTGQGHASTKQLPYKIELYGGVVVRPRFHVIRMKKLNLLKIG